MVVGWIGGEKGNRYPYPYPSLSLYAVVPGFLLGYKERTDEHGRPVSRVEPIRDEALRAEIQHFVLLREQVTQCNFL